MIVNHNARAKSIQAAHGTLTRQTKPKKVGFANVRGRGPDAGLRPPFSERFYRISKPEKVRELCSRLLPLSSLTPLSLGWFAGTTSDVSVQTLKPLLSRPPSPLKIDPTTSLYKRLQTPCLTWSVFGVTGKDNTLKAGGRIIPPPLETHMR